MRFAEVCHILEEWSPDSIVKGAVTNPLLCQKETTAGGWWVTFVYCLTEIRNGNLKAILGLFFSLSRYKQQQQQPQKQPAQHHLSQPAPSVSLQAGPASQGQAGPQQQQVPASLQTQCQQPQQAVQHPFKAQPEMQSRWGNFFWSWSFHCLLGFLLKGLQKPAFLSSPEWGVGRGMLGSS